MAKTSDEWTNYFLKERSGTHNNQWVIIDPKNLESKKKVVVYLEDAFSIYEISDVSDMLFENGYVATYNMAYNKNIYYKLGQ